MEQDVFEIIDGDYNKNLLLIADHASNYMPASYNGLGLSDAQLARHIAYDIGVKEFTIKLAKKLNVPAVLSKFSRLLIDPNRGVDDPTLVMRLADGEIVEGYRNIDNVEKLNRIERFYKPYDDAILKTIGRFEEPPTLFSIHSFTPIWRGNKRSTEVGLLWNEEYRFTKRLFDALSMDTDYIVDENRPYFGGLDGDTMDRHGLKLGLEHSLLELRQDYMSTTDGINEWVDVFASILPKTVKNYT